MHPWEQFKRVINLLHPTRRETVIARHAFYSGYLCVLEEMQKNGINCPNRLRGFGASVRDMLGKMFDELEKEGLIHATGTENEPVPPVSPDEPAHPG